MFGSNRKTWTVKLTSDEKMPIDKLKRKIADERGCKVEDVTYAEAVNYLINEYQFNNEL